MDNISHGVMTGDTLHLLTAVRRGDEVIVAPTEAMAAAVPTIDPLAVPGYLRAADPQFLHSVAVTGVGENAHEVLGTTLQRVLDIGNLEAGSIAAALGGGNDNPHLLRFVATDADGQFVGGYSLIVTR
jgi:hypothetical protein